MGWGRRSVHGSPPRSPDRVQHRVALAHRFAGDERAFVVGPRPGDRCRPAPTLTANSPIPTFMVGTRREEVFATPSYPVLYCRSHPPQQGDQFLKIVGEVGLSGISVDLSTQVANYRCRVFHSDPVKIYCTRSVFMVIAFIPPVPEFFQPRSDLISMQGSVVPNNLPMLVVTSPFCPSS